MTFEAGVILSGIVIGIGLFVIYYLSETMGKTKMSVCLKCHEPMSVGKNRCSNCGGYYWIWDWV